MELIKFFIEEPGKIKLLIISLFKLLLTILIVNGIFNICEYNDLSNLLNWNSKKHLGKILLYATTLIGVWAIIWEFLDSLFLLLISIRSKKKVDLENERHGFIGFFLRMFNVYSHESEHNENGEISSQLLPGDNIYDVIDITEYIEKENGFDMKNSIFAEVLFIICVGWFYLLFNFKTLDINYWQFSIFTLIPILSIVIYRVLDGFLIYIKDHSSSYSRFFDILAFRKHVMDTVVEDFGGNINIFDRTFDIHWNKKIYQLRDYSYYHEGLGNRYLTDQLRAAVNDNLTGFIAVLNFKPNEELIKVITVEKGMLGIIVVENENELLDNIVIELNRLDKTVS